MLLVIVFRDLLIHYSVAPSTLTQYKSHWTSHWIPFINQYHLQQDPFLSDYTVEQQKNMIASFVLHMVHSKQHSYTTINLTLSSVRHFFDVNFCPNTEQIFDPASNGTLRKAKLASKRISSSLLIDTPKRKQMAITLDMIQHLRDQVWTTSSALVDRKMEYVAIAFAFNFCLRVSEFTQVSTSPKHNLMCTNIEFRQEKSNSSWSPAAIRELQVPKASIDTFYGRLLTSKADQYGLGRILHITRSTPLESQLLDDLHFWCLISVVQDKDPFFTRYAPTRKLLTRKDVVTTLKNLAQTFGLNPLDISSRSLRIGGATTQRIAGTAREVTKKIGGWADKSNCDLIYQRTTKLDGGTLAQIQQSSESKTLSIEHQLSTHQHRQYNHNTNTSFIINRNISSSPTTTKIEYLNNSPSTLLLSASSSEESDAENCSLLV